MEFGYIDVRDEEEGEEHTLLNHFVLDGDSAHANLLQFALTEENVDHTTVLVCTSMTTPWTVIDQLSKWIRVLQDHLDQLDLSPDQVRELRSSKKVSSSITVGYDRDVIHPRVDGSRIANLVTISPCRLGDTLQPPR